MDEIVISKSGSREDVARWLVDAPGLFRLHSLLPCLTGFSFLSDNSVKTVLTMVAETQRMPLADVYAIGEREHWIAPGSRTFTPIPPVQRHPLNPKPSPEPVRRPEPVLSSVAEEISSLSPPDDAPLAAYLKDDDIFPSEGIEIPTFRRSLEAFREAEEDMWHRLFGAVTEVTYAPVISLRIRTVAELITLLRFYCFDPSMQVSLGSPNPCGGTEHYPSFLKRMHAYFLQVTPPSSQIDSVYVSQVLFPQLEYLATANNPRLATALCNYKYDGYSFRDLDDIFSFFHSYWFIDLMESRPKPSRRPKRLNQRHRQGRKKRRNYDDGTVAY